MSSGPAERTDNRNTDVSRVINRTTSTIRFHGRRCHYYTLGRRRDSNRYPPSSVPDDVRRRIINAPGFLLPVIASHCENTQSWRVNDFRYYLFDYVFHTVRSALSTITGIRTLVFYSRFYQILNGIPRRL